jgi:hypothetical protein
MTAILIRFEGAELPKTLDGSIVGIISAPAAPTAEFFKKFRLVVLICIKFY